MPDEEAVADRQIGPRAADEGQPEASLPGERRDNVGSDRDDAAEKRDLAGDQRDIVGSDRDDAAAKRDLAGNRRDVAADRRDADADQRDLVSRDRDAAADARDAAADERDRAWFEAGHYGSNAEYLSGVGSRRDAAENRGESAYDRHAGAADRSYSENDRHTSSADRGAGCSERSYSEHDRSTSSADRGAGASERSDSERDRTASSADRSAGASERQAAELDALTGTYLRGAGLMELGREMAKAHRTGQSLTIAFVDVDRLKIVNDSRGHAAGDQLLIQVVRTIRSKMRAYDLLLRYGGDEFVCVASGLDMAQVTTRFALVHSELSVDVHDPSISVGFAALLPNDSVETLLARADEMLYRYRQLRRNTLHQ